MLWTHTADAINVLMYFVEVYRKSVQPIYVSGADMLIFTVSVIGTYNQRSRYSACKINFYLTHAKEHIATKSR